MGRWFTSPVSRRVEVATRKGITLPGLDFRETGIRFLISAKSFVIEQLDEEIEYAKEDHRTHAGTEGTDS
jgi:hypothetical protein